MKSTEVQRCRAMLFGFVVLLALFQIMSFHAEEQEGLNREDDKEDEDGGDQMENLLPREPKAADKMVLLHIGKTGGSSLRCMLHKQLWEAECKEMEASITIMDTLLSNRIIEVCHMSHCSRRQFDSNSTKFFRAPNGGIHEYVVETYPNVVVSTRNPVERMISVFYYSRQEIEEWFRGKIQDQSLEAQPFRYRAQQLSDCYSTFGDLAEDLAGLLPAHNRTKIEPEVEGATGLNCTTLASVCMSGDVGCPDHNIMGYRHYLKSIVNATVQPTPTVYVIRNEFKLDDFARLDSKLAGKQTQKDGNETQAIILRKSPGERSISKEGRVALCETICAEIRVYVKILEMALNLRPIDVEQSVSELEESCGGRTILTLCPEEG